MTLIRTFGRQVRDHGGITSDEWCSPPEVADPLFDFWGKADCDPCGNERSVIRAKTIYHEFGLTRSWKKKSYLNHPYSQNEPWISKAIHEMKVQNVRELVVLCMTATSTVWWQSLMLKPRRNPRVICTKRLSFLGPDGEKVDSSRFEPALIYYGARTAAFDRNFKSIARWSTWGR